MGIFSETHIFLLLIIVLIIFGPTKLPQLARSIGKSVRELKDGLSDAGNDRKPSSNSDWENKTTPQSDAQPVHRNENQSDKPA